MPALLLVQEGEFTPFSINTGLIFWTLVVFGVLLALLWRLGWPALLKAVEERERRIQQQLEEAERARAEAARLLEEHKRTMAAARAEAQELIAQARAVAEKERAALLAQAREQYEQLLDRARKEIESEKEKAILELRREAVDLSIAAASKLIEAKLNRVHAGVTLLEEPDARLEQELIERLSRTIGKEVRAHFRADRAILGGVMVRVGDRIYDGSVRRKLALLRRKLVTGE